MPGEPSGPVRGTGASDHVPALLMPKEFVHTRASVAREGVAAHHALNQGKATIVPIDRKRREQRRERFARGGHVGRARGVQRFARGGVVRSGRSVPGRVAGYVEELLGDVASQQIKHYWSLAKGSANRALGAIPDQDKIVGAVGAGSGRKILAGADAKVQELLAKLQKQEEADRRARAEAEYVRRKREQNRDAAPGPIRSTRPLTGGGAPGDGFVRAVAQRFPATRLNRVGERTINLMGGPMGDVARFVRDNQKALRVSKLTKTGTSSMRAEVYHEGGGVGYNPSKEVLALLQRGEGIASIETMAKMETAMKGVTSSSTPVVEGGRNVTVINIEINNPVGEPSETSIHRGLQRVAAHGLLGEDVA